MKSFSRIHSYGFDVLYAPDDAEPRWRGFDAGDTIEVKEES